MKRLGELLRDYEKTIIVATLKRNEHDRRKTAHALGITRRALDKMMIRHGIASPHYARPLPIPARRRD